MELAADFISYESSGISFYDETNIKYFEPKL